MPLEAQQPGGLVWKGQVRRKPQQWPNSAPTSFTYVGFAQANSASSQVASEAVTIPANVALGDSCWIIFESYSTSSGSTTLSVASTGSAWSQLGTTQYVAGTSSQFNTAIYYLSAGASDAGKVVTCSVASNRFINVTLVVYRSSAGTWSVDNYAIGSSATLAATAVVPATTTVGINDWALYFASICNGGSGFSSNSAPAGATMREDNFGSSSGIAAAADSNGSIAANTSIGGGHFTPNTTGAYVTYTIALSPFAGGISQIATPTTLTTSVAFPAPAITAAGSPVGMLPQPGGQTWRRFNRRKQQIPPTATTIVNANITASDGGMCSVSFPSPTVSGPKIATLVDNFASNDLSTLWDNTAGTVTWSANQVAIQCDTSYNAWLSSTGDYDLTSSSIYAQFNPYIATDAQTYFQLVPANSTAAQNNIECGYSAGQSYLNYTVNGSVTYAFGVTYDPVNHAWYRVRESAGTIYFDAAPDGATWTNLYSVSDATVAFSLTALNVTLRAGDYGADPTGTSYVYNVNSGTTSASITNVSDGGMCSVAFPAVQVNAGEVTTTAALTTSVAFPAVQVNAGEVVTTTALTTSVSFPVVQINAGEVVTTSALNTSVNFPAETINASETITTSALVTSVSFPAVQVNASETVTTSVLNGTVSFPADTVNAGEVVTTSALTTSVSFPSVTINAGSGVTPSALTTSVSFPAVQVNASETIVASDGGMVSVAFPATTITAAGSPVGMLPQPGGQTWRRFNRRAQQIPPPSSVISSNIVASDGGMCSVSFPAPSVSTAGNVNITPTTLTTSVSFPSVTVNAGEVITTSALTTSVSFDTNDVNAGEVVTTADLSTSVSFPAPTVNAGEVVTTTVLTTSVSFPATTVSTGSSVNITPSALTTSVSFPAATVNASETVTTSVLAATTTFPAVTVHAGEVVTTSALNVSATFSGPVVNASETVTTPVLTTSVSFGAVINAGAKIVPSALTTSVSFNIPLVNAGSGLFPSALATSATFLTPSVRTDSNLTTTALATSATFAAPKIIAISTASLSEELLGGTATSATFYGTATANNNSFSGTATSGLLASGTAVPSTTITSGTGTQGQLMSIMINLEAYENNDTPFYLAVTTIVNNQTVPLNITSYTPTVYVKASSVTPDSGATLYTSGLGLVITSAYLGQITWTLPHTAATTAGTYWWRLDLASSGNVSTVMYGNLYILAV